MNIDTIYVIIITLLSVALIFSIIYILKILLIIKYLKNPGFKKNRYKVSYFNTNDIQERIDFLKKARNNLLTSNKDKDIVNEKISDIDKKIFYLERIADHKNTLKDMIKNKRKPISPKINNIETQSEIDNEIVQSESITETNNDSDNYADTINIDDNENIDYESNTDDDFENKDTNISLNDEDNFDDSDYEEYPEYTEQEDTKNDEIYDEELQL